MLDNGDSDYGYGSHNKRKAAKMVREERKRGYVDAYILILDLVFDETGIELDPIICGKIHDVRGI